MRLIQEELFIFNSRKWCKFGLRFCLRQLTKMFCLHQSQISWTNPAKTPIKSAFSACFINTIWMYFCDYYLKI